MADQGQAAPAGGGGDDHGRGFGRRGRGGRRGRRFEGENKEGGEGGGGDGDRRGGRRGRGRRGRRGGRDDGDKEWVPVTKLGRLVQAGYIKTLEEIYVHALPIKEFQIVDKCLGDALKDEVMKITPVQKQTAAGQRTKFKAWVIVGDNNGHLGLGVKCSKEVAGAIRGAIIDAKLNVVPIRRGHWSTQKFGAPHTVPCKLKGKCGSVMFRIVPAPRGTGLVAGKVPKKVLIKAGITDAYTCSRGSTKTLGNFVFATYRALMRGYRYLTPELWENTPLDVNPYQRHTVFLQENKKVVKQKSLERGAAQPV